MPTLYECDIDYYINKFVASKYGEGTEWFVLDVPIKRTRKNYTEVYLYISNGKTIFDEGFDCVDTNTKLKITEKLILRKINIKIKNYEQIRTKRKIKNVSIK